MSTVLVVMNDLFFAPSISHAVQSAGMTAVFVRDVAAFDQALASRPAVIIFDLGFGQIDPLHLIRRIKDDAATSATFTLAFVPHVQVELKRQAEEHGCDQVVPRSVFAVRLPELLRNRIKAEVPQSD